MKHPIDMIVGHAGDQWRHIPSGDVFTVVWAAPREVLAISLSATWRGTACQFLREFEVYK